MEYVWLALLPLIVAFFAVILIRTLAFKPKEVKRQEPKPVSFDKERAVAGLQALVRCKTVSYYSREEEDEAEFKKLIDLLPTLYPNVFAKCSFLQMEDRAILLKWEGKGHDAPSVMMSHYDVVPVVESDWSKPPFEGIIEDGVLWGRGTLDTKVTMNAALSAADNLIENGYTPEQDVYFAFSGGEEVNGLGAVHIVDYFAEKGITPALVLDEGGAVVEDVFPGVKSPSAMIGIAEKGMIDVLYTNRSHGGHASAPKPHTPVGVLSKACCRVEGHPFKAHITPPVAAMFDTLGRHSNFLYRLIFANLWCFSWVLDILGKMSGGEMNALLRTTVAFTRMEGSSTNNVIPTEARMVSNIRLNPADTVEGALSYLEKTIGDTEVSLSKIQGTNPSPISKIDAAYDKIASAVSETWQGSIVSPYLMVQCSDSRHYGKISDHVYRFSAMDLTKEERATIHGSDERIRLETLYKSVDFYIRLLRQC